jgi:hypothetical protein
MAQPDKLNAEIELRVHQCAMRIVATLIGQTKDIAIVACLDAAASIVRSDKDCSALQAAEGVAEILRDIIEAERAAANSTTAN